MFCFLKIAFACFLSACSVLCNAITDHNLLDTMTKYDLELISAQGKTLYSVLDKTITSSGKKALDDFLVHPTDDIATLQARQSYLLFLERRTQLRADLREQLTIAAACESSLSARTDDLGKKALERVYFSLPFLQRYNSSPYGLDVAYVANLVGTCAPLFEHIIMHLGIQVLASGSTAKKSDHGHKHKDHKHEHKHHHGCDHSHGSTGLAYYGLQAFHWGLHIPGLYEMACDIKQKALMVSYLQNRMITVANYLRAAERMHSLLQENNADVSGFAPYVQLGHFFGKKAECSHDFKKLLTLFGKSTFSGHASVFNHVGNVLAAFTLCSKIEDECALLAKAISEIDVYAAMADLIANQTERDPWCFAAFNTDQKPELILKQVRNLFVTESKPLDFSSQEGAHTIVLGDNGSGKSTYLLSIGHAVVLAQTFAIAPAHSCELTPFSHMYTFRFIQDNMFEGTSRFYAESARVQTIIDAISADGKPALVLFDEPFTSTTAQKGASYLENMLHEVAPIDSTISLLATHYHESADAVTDTHRIKHLSSV